MMLKISLLMLGLMGAAMNAMAQTPPAVAPYDVTIIADSAARRAVEELRPRLAALAAAEYTYVMTSEKPAGESGAPAVTRDECAFRPPHFIFQKSTSARTINAKALIRTTYIVFDGKTLWVHTSGQLGPGANPADIYPGMPEQFLRSAVQRELDPHIIRIDLERVQRETGDAPISSISRLLIIPHLALQGYDATTLALGPPPDERHIVLHARPRPARPGAAEADRLAFSREDGSLQVLEQAIGGTGSAGGTERFVFSDYNRDTHLSPTHFTFLPPRGIPIRDATTAFIESAGAFTSSASPLSEAQALNVTRSRVRLMSLAAALEAYSIHHGQYPNDLARLTPPAGYLPRIPDDPFRAGHPLQYRRLSGRDWIAWSVGPDGVDDGGEKALDLDNLPAGEKGDIVRRKQ